MSAPSRCPAESHVCLPPERLVAVLLLGTRSLQVCRHRSSYTSHIVLRVHNRSIVLSAMSAEDLHEPKETRVSSAERRLEVDEAYLRSSKRQDFHLFANAKRDSVYTAGMQAVQINTTSVEHFPRHASPSRAVALCRCALSVMNLDPLSGRRSATPTSSGRSSPVLRAERRAVEDGMCVVTLLAISCSTLTVGRFIQGGQRSTTIWGTH